jgi:methylenetetrahydrofolate reductase (NADPH)
MATLFRRKAGLTDAEREALRRVVGGAKLELIPLKNLADQIPSIPAGAHVSVTASPAKGIEATIDLSTSLHELGLVVTPHLSARMIRDRQHVADLLARLKDAGIDRAFVVGGDADDPGEFLDGLSLLRAMAEVGHHLTDIGVPCYPQGHPDIPDEYLLPALRDKAEFVHYTTTQLCFDPGAIRRWVDERRAEGFELPVVIGIPGVTEPQRLLSISARLGVKDTKRFVLKNARFVARMVRSAGFYQPDGLLRDLAPLFADPEARVEGIHVYTFNGVTATEEWRAAYVAGLAG